MHLPQGLQKLLKDHFGKLIKSTILYRRSFWKMFRFGKDMVIWSTMNEWCFFLYFCFASFGYIFQDITMSWPAVLFLEAAGHALSLKPLYDEIVKKNFWHFFLKISTLRGSWIFFDNFSKKKKNLSNQNRKDADRQIRSSKVLQAQPFENVWKITPALTV